MKLSGGFRRVMLYLLILPVLIYGGAMILAFLFAEKLIFQPPPAFYRDDGSVIKIETPDGEKISARYLHHPEAEYTLLFSHGNAEDIGSAETFLRDLRDAGFSVFAYDYRGYGTSEGTPSEANAYEDIEAAYRFLTGELEIPPDRIILHGRSLGGAVAIDLAARRECAGLIVESSFTSAFRVVTGYRLLPFDKFTSIDKIDRIRCPVLFIHGRKDTLVSFRHAEELYAAAGADRQKYRLWIDRANHNDLFAISEKSYLQAIKEFSAKLAK